jgi:hypothetical protein
VRQTRSVCPVAEHLDLINAPFWQAFGPVLGTLLQDAGEGPLIDIGASTGTGLKTMANALPQHEIIAIEPSQALRAGLFARLSEDPALAERVTVLPATVQEAALPPRLGAVVGINMPGHLRPTERTALCGRAWPDGSAHGPLPCSPSSHRAAPNASRT